MVVFLRKNHFLKSVGLTFCSTLDWGSYIIFIAKTASKKIRALIRSMNFRSPEVTLYLYKTTRWTCMEYSCHVQAGGFSCYKDFYIRDLGSALAACLETLAQCGNEAGLTLFYRYYFGIHLSHLAQQDLILILEGDLLHNLIDCMIFLSPFLDHTRMYM